MPRVSVCFDLLDQHLPPLMSSANRLLSEIRVKHDESGRESVVKFAKTELVKTMMDLMGRSSAVNCIDIIDGRSDLLANQYEGGFKVWDGCHDLIAYINELDICRPYLNRDRINILDLGCGAGLVSLFCRQRLPNANIYMQDFNEDVIKYFTSVNVWLNGGDGGDRRHFSFMCGDWDDIARDLADEGVRFELIVSSETIYNVANYAKLVRLLKASLSADGVAYMAAKSHYFGVGGGTYDFVEFVENDGELVCEVLREIEAPLVRHILRVCWKARHK